MKALNNFAGTKFLQASDEITKAEYCAIRGWELPANEDPNELGRLVVYPQPKGKPHNHPDYNGYVSWSPKFAFDEAYRESGKMNFGHAVEAAKAGKKVARLGWNGVGMYAVVMPGFPDGIEVNESTAKAHNVPIGTKMTIRPYWQLFTAQKDIATWSPSGSDSLAEDWCIVE
jgi:hypothetical protein